MRILFVSSPGLGHINPMVPLAQALGRRGHEVRWLVAAGFTDYLERTGFVADAGGLGERERWRRVRSLVSADEQAPGPPAGFGGPSGFATLFARVGAPAMAESLETLTHDWKPGLIVHDMSELASAPIAASLGIPHVTHSWAWALPPEIYGLAAEFTAPLWTDRGLQPREDAGVFEYLFVHPYPADLASGGPPPPGKLQPIRPAAVATTAQVPKPDWLETIGRDAIYLTLGTIFSDAVLLRGTIDALLPLGRPLVVTTGPLIAPGELGSLPAQCHVASYIPQDAVLPHCALVVSHAGAGTFLGAAAMGVPQVCLPQGADQFLNAQVAERSGIGVALAPDRRTPLQVLDAARRVLDTSTYRDRSEEVRRLIAAMPSADDVAPVVEAAVRRD